MKKRNKFLSFSVMLIIFSMSAWIMSCSKSSDPISADVKASVNNETAQQSQQDEIDDIATGQMNAQSASGGRADATSDDRTTCAKITATVSDKQGSILIDFDTNKDGSANASGCTDPRGNTRKGKITVAWSGGKWYQQGAIIVITLDNYSINGVVIAGTRTLTNITDPAHPLMFTWTVVASHTATWPDGTTATRTVNETRLWDVLNGFITTTQTSPTVNAAFGVNRDKHSYSVQITGSVSYIINCALTAKVYIPVTGQKVFTIDNTTALTVDFGDGTCDNVYTVTINGKTDTFTAVNN